MSRFVRYVAGPIAGTLLALSVAVPALADRPHLGQPPTNPILINAGCDYTFATRSEDFCIPDIGFATYRPAPAPLTRHTDVLDWQCPGGGCLGWGPGTSGGDGEQPNH